MSETLALTGNCFVGRFLTREYPERQLPASPQAGDVQVYCHLDERGRANRELDDRRKRRGTLKRTKTGYSGYIVALVFDGSQWRRLLLEDFIAAHKARYTSQKWKHWRLSDVFWAVEQASGRALVRDVGGFSVGEPIVAACLAAPLTGAGDQLALF